MQTPQNEMQQLINTCLNSGDFHAAWECLEIYHQSFGSDSFYESSSILLLNLNGPKVTLIGLDVSASALETYLSAENYTNLEFVQFAGHDYINDLASYLPSCDSTYFCFLEENQSYTPDRIASMIYHIEQWSGLDAVVCTRNHIDADGSIIAHPDYAYEETLGNKILAGKLLLEYSINANVNLYGIPSTLMVSLAYAETLTLSDANVAPDICAMALLYQLLLPARIGYLYTPYVSTHLMAYRDTSAVQAHYASYIAFLSDSGQLSCTAPDYAGAPKFPVKEKPLARDITFITKNVGGEYYNVLPLIEEAKRRGYQVHVTDDRYAKAEIGIYSQHICHPENSKFSLIMLHDMAQGTTYWPNFWEVERWNHFDIGILPGKSWAKRWEACNCFYYAHPRQGVYTLGYPKSDQISGEELSAQADMLRSELGLKYDYTILYAPSWENDGKEDDFIQALSSLEVNLIIKQDYSQFYPDIQKNIDIMRALHEHKYDNVHYLAPESGIMTAIALSDLLVSDESNVMIEAILLHKPSIAVTDWLIPDENPSRPAFFPIDFVIKCRKAELRKTVESVMAHTLPYEEFIQKGLDTFSNIGNSCREIMDAIEYFTQGPDASTSDFLSKQVTSSKYTSCNMWN